ncbi:MULTISPECIES: hypothetical protein [Salimicrobium]|uniref:HEAT repeat domain-containing protein n=1 Tax=Salimicrobium humidisoli TaxID=2029857 RepID=A0ABX4HVA5_9BACI|nr:MULTISPECIES: hypothetical protein [Salimicrobium]PBB06973.1 hypothetical protein CKW00_00520 [Salimicrobium humidisoli]
MDNRIEQLFEEWRNGSGEAHRALLEEMETEVSWSYEVWDRLVGHLDDGDARLRSEAAQFLSYLAVSDPEDRIMRDFQHVWQVTKDEDLTAARRALQSVWRIALGGARQKNLVTGSMIERFYTAAGEKNGTLLREDIVRGLAALYERDDDPYIDEQAKGLIDNVDDPEEAKTYYNIWKQ